MGGGDLNAKKSWHPNTLKNQERVWKVEQADAAEKRKLAELQKEISEERNREELKKIAHTSGVIDMGDSKKLEWMYKGPTDMVNREDYLLGRPVDKTFDQLSAETDQLIGVTVPKNHVEHECIPFSIRAFRGTQGGEQVDMARKIMEDPLMAIKQKEMESRRKILENPVKLKELHRLLKIDQPKSKKSKKKDKKKRRKSSDSESGNDLDELLARKYKKIQSVINDESGEANLDLNQLLEDKYDKLTKELDKMGTKRKHSKSSGRDKRSPTPERPRRRDEKRQRSPSPVRSRHVVADEEGSSRIVTKNYGLVSADGRSIRIEGRRREERSRPSETSSRKVKWTRPERQRLTEEEKEAKRREMMDNAVWRDRERERNVKRYREDDREAKAKDASREFDRNFINKELHKAVSRETVESRIKSNVNNIQRSSHSMNANFARR